jgi:hypothetical protein
MTSCSGGNVAWRQVKDELVIGLADLRLSIEQSRIAIEQTYDALRKADEILYAGPEVKGAGRRDDGARKSHVSSAHYPPPDCTDSGSAGVGDIFSA